MPHLLKTAPFAHLALAVMAFGFTSKLYAAEDTAWVSMITEGDFDGKNFKNWTARFSGKSEGDNIDTTFRMSTEGYLWANNHGTFKSFGHLYYTKRKYSYYIVRGEYRFTTDVVVNGGAEWATQNNGIMLHCPAPKDVSGDFPASVETQLLGPKNRNDQDRRQSTDWPVGLTGNMCLAGDQFTISYKGNNNYTSHCTSASYPIAWKGTQTPWATGWAETTARVLSDSLIQFTIHGEKVMELGNIRLTSNKSPVKDGYIAIQAEGAPTQFRKLEVLDLVGCMDKASTSYRTYFVKNDATLCEKVTKITNQPSMRGTRKWQNNRHLALKNAAGFPIGIFAADGRKVLP
jgi:hypothetical protein